MAISASALRQNIYRILDEVIQKGIPVDIVRKGETLKIIPAKTENKLKNLKNRKIMKYKPETYIHMDWYHTWKK